MPIDLYSHPLSPPSRACLITGKLLNVPLNVKDVDVLAGAHLTAEYLAINPNHAVPALVDGNFKLTESRAIITYLANKYAPDSSLYPKDAQARAQVDKVLFFDASTFYPSLMAVYFPIFRLKQAAPQAAIDTLTEKVRILECILGDEAFFAGSQITLADISLAVSIPTFHLFFPTLLSAKLSAWYDRVETEAPIVKELHQEMMKHPLLVAFKPI